MIFICSLNIYLVKCHLNAKYSALSHTPNKYSHSKVTVYVLKLQWIKFVTETIANRLKIE